MSGERDLDQQLASYGVPDPKVESVRGSAFTAFVGDDVPTIGEGLWVGAPEGRVLARVSRLAGNRRVEAVTLSESSAVVVGAPVARASAQAHLPGPGAGDTLDLSRASFVLEGEGALGWSPGRPGFAALDARRPALTLGMDALDLLSPLAARGANLVVDQSADASAFVALVEAARTALSPDALLCVEAPGLESIVESSTHTVRPGGSPEGAAWALRAVALWGERSRAAVGSTLVVVSLPAWSIDEADFRFGGETGLEVSFSELVDWLGEALVSTREGAVTLVMRVPVEESARGLADLADTLAVGDVDAQVFFEAGVYDPRRSRSRAEQPDEARVEALRTRGAIARADASRERAALFGDDEIGFDEESDMELAAALEDLDLGSY